MGSYFGAMVAALVVALKNDSPSAMQASIWNGVGFGFVFWMFSISFLNRVLIQGVSRASIGKKLFKIEIVSAVGPLTWSMVTKRWLLGYVSLLAGGAGFLYSFFNREGHTFHDVLTGTDVIPLFESATIEMEHLEQLVGEPRVPNMARITSMSFILSNVQAERPESTVIYLPVRSDAATGRDGVPVGIPAPKDSPKTDELAARRAALQAARDAKQASSQASSVGSGSDSGSDEGSNSGSEAA